MNKENLMIIKKDDRFVITDKDNNIIDDAQGYGYKSKEKAAKALWWKFKGGKDTTADNERKFQTWLKSSEENQLIYNSFINLIEINFKEIAIGETKIDELFNIIETEMNIILSNDVRFSIKKHYQNSKE